MIRTLTIAVVLVLAPVTLLPQEVHTVETWNTYVTRKLWEPWPNPDTIIQHGTAIDKGSVMSAIQALSHVVPFNTRLRIHWLDSVPVVLSTTFVILRDNDIHDGGTRLDTTGWRMTECSLSVAEEEAK